MLRVDAEMGLDFERYVQNRRSGSNQMDETLTKCIRETQITFWEVYKKLTFHGLSEEQVRLEHPELEPEDLTAVREFIAASIKSRTHDEFTGRSILSRGQLRHGAYYKGRCRNATVARWSADEQRFYHWRKKFDRIYIETIKYPTDEEEYWWDVFDVVEELPNPKFEIPFDIEATFGGKPEDLIEFNEEMWHRPKRQEYILGGNAILGR